ncbi:hypothetical protein Tco_0915329 [Tanacetum coccineum]
MVGCSIYTDTSVLTQRELDLHCLTYNIPAELRPDVPDRNSTIKDSPEGKIGMYTRFIEFANYQIRLSKFLLCVLEYYQINLSQLSVIGAAKDPLPVDEAVNLPCVELLNEKRTLIRKYLETFLCLVGLSRSFVETDIRPTLLRDDDEEMGLLDFVRAMDPFKVKVGERTLAENEVPLVTKTEDRVVSPSSQTICLVDHTIQDELNVNSSCNISHFQVRIYQKSQENRQKRANTDSRNGRAQKKPKTQSQSQEKLTLGQLSVNSLEDKTSKCFKSTLQVSKVTKIVP